MAIPTATGQLGLECSPSHRTNLSSHCKLADYIEHVEQQFRLGIPAANIVQTRQQPVADASGPLSIWSQEEELLQKRVGQNRHKLVGQIDLFEVLDEGLCAVNLFQGNRVLVMVRPRALFRGQRRARGLLLGRAACGQ